MAAKSFYEVLEAQVRSELRKEIEAEVRAEIGRERGQSSQKPQQPCPAMDWVDSWLVGNVAQTTFSTSGHARRAYDLKSGVKQDTKSDTNETAASRAEPAAAPKPVPKPSPKPLVSPRTLEEVCALELLRRHSGLALGDAFTEDELRLAWRRAALKTHPDRFSQADRETQEQMAALFSELSDAHARLSRLLA